MYGGYFESANGAPIRELYTSEAERMSARYLYLLQFLSLAYAAVLLVLNLLIRFHV